MKGFFLWFPLHATRICPYCAGAMPQRINSAPEGRSVTCALTRQQQQKVGVTAAFPWQLTYAYATVWCHHSGGKWMQSWLNSIPEFWCAALGFLTKHTCHSIINTVFPWNKIIIIVWPYLFYISENATCSVLCYCFVELQAENFPLFSSDSCASRNFYCAV
jgi:hypothetical protein